MDGKNKLYFGDNLKILRDYVEDASVDLIYLDPPFNSSATYNVLFKEKTAEEFGAPRQECTQMICPICGKSRNLIAGVLAGARHPDCAKAEAQRLGSEALAREKAEADRRREQHEKLMGQVTMGVFKSLNHEAEIMLDEGETCCAMVKGCWSTLFYPRAAGRAAPGQAVRVDGLKKSDWGTLHVTDKRICFVGRGGARTLPIKKLLQCETHNDVLHITAEGRASSSYFIIESQEALEMLATSIRKLAALAKAREKPVIE